MIFTEGAELTCGIIDLITGIVLAFLTALIKKTSGDKELKKKWMIFLFFVSLSNILGAIVHIIDFKEIVFDIIWIFIYFSMYSLALSFFDLSLFEFTNHKSPNKNTYLFVHSFGLIMYILSTVVGFYTVREVRIFVVFASLVDAPAFLFFIINGIREKKKSTIYIVVAFLFQLFGFYFQITKTGDFTLIFDFDHNGIYHICLLFTCIILYFIAREDIMDEKVQITMNSNVTDNENEEIFD